MQPNLSIAAFNPASNFELPVFAILLIVLGVIILARELTKNRFQ